MPKRNGRTFDRFPERSRNAAYPIRGLIQPAELTRERVMWTKGQVLDQGEDGACVAFAWTHEMLSTPVRVDLAAVQLPNKWPRTLPKFSRRLYFAIQRHDQWEGGAYPNATEVYEGTSVVAGARQMVRLGFLREYRWAATPYEVRDALLALGPVVLGVMWFDGMFDAPGGVLTVQGQPVGGHCVLLIGYEPDRDLGNGPEPAYAVLNSWGPGWGDDGVGWVSESGLTALLSNDGEACVPVSRSYGTPR